MASVAVTDCVVLGGLGTNSRFNSAPLGSTQYGGIALGSPLQQRNGTAKIFVSTRRPQSMRSTSSRPRSLVVRAAKLPAGVDPPVEEPNLPVSLWGFTEKAEVWNSRVAMLGLFGLIALEFVTHKGILQMIGVDVGKGLDLPL
ncbi:unnamed protein product [Calypogeia fissa]